MPWGAWPAPWCGPSLFSRRRVRLLLPPGGGSGVTLTQLRYRGGEWDPHPHFLPPLTEEVAARTSVVLSPARRLLSLTDPDLFTSPFLYLTGRYAYDPLREDEVAHLRRYLQFGGFLLADDAFGRRGWGFDRSFREMMRQVFPERELTRLPADHSIYRSFYLLRRAVGRLVVAPFLEGILVDGTTPVVYSPNDLAGAWERDPDGRWLSPCEPGGEAQRREAFHLGVNVIVFALSEDYKTDLLHHPFIQRRLLGRGAGR